MIRSRLYLCLNGTQAGSTAGRRDTMARSGSLASKPVRLVAPRSVLARLRCYLAPRRFQRDVVAHHFPDVILQFCLNAKHGIDSLQKVAKSVTATPKGRTDEAIR